jgi:toxin ParE1/3/4
LKLRFTRRATVQITTALDYVAARSPQGAASIRDRLRELVTLLEGHPNAGRRTNKPGVRRLAANPYPYFIDYRVAETEIIVMRFRHAARRPRG